MFREKCSQLMPKSFPHVTSQITSINFPLNSPLTQLISTRTGLFAASHLLEPTKWKLPSFRLSPNLKPEYT